MSDLRFVLDWTLIILSTVLAFKSYRRIIYASRASVGEYVFLVLWVFCCLPIFFDYLIGRPTYTTVYWYQVFIISNADDAVSCIYDSIILVACILLYMYSKHASRNSARPSKKWGGLIFDNKPLLILLVVSPVLYIVATGHTSNYLVYGVTSFRGLSGNSVSTVVSGLLLVSVLAFCNLFFKRQRLVFTDVIVLIAYSFAAAWIEGKRFIIAIMILLYFYYFMQRNPSEKVRRRLEFGLPIAVVVLLFFSGFYLMFFRPLSDTGFNSVYEMLRVDYGRDDVVKYVIYHEFFLHDHILEYYGETFLSTFLVWVPRSVWSGKPYQHYQYLTSSILNLPIDQLPAGTTPCWFEMCIANFSHFGIVLSWALLVLFVWLSDRTKSISTESILMMLIIVLLTQSVDAYFSFLVVLGIQYVLGFLFEQGKRGVSNIPMRRGASSLASVNRHHRDNAVM